MFFYLLKNSTIIELELDENTRNTKILIYGAIAYIVLHATLFLGGDDALLNCLKPYFWLFFALDVGIITLNSDIDVLNLIKVNRENKTKPIPNKELQPQTRSVTKQINNVFDTFLKAGEIDGNERINSKIKPTLLKVVLSNAKRNQNSMGRNSISAFRQRWFQYSF